MKLLSDPHVLLWALPDDPALRLVHRDAIATRELYLFAACVRKIGIRRALGKLDVPDDLFEVAARNGGRSLPITGAMRRSRRLYPPTGAIPSTGC